MRTFVLIFTTVILATGSLAAQVPTPADKPAAPQTSGYGAWFGSIPNMEKSNAGIVLSGTTPDSPAEKAGLLRGDRIVAMAGDPVVDLMAMVKVLRSHVAGDTIKVVYIREPDIKQQTVKVVLGVRPGN